MFAAGAAPGVKLGDRGTGRTHRALVREEEEEEEDTTHASVARTTHTGPPRLVLALLLLGTVAVAGLWAREESRARAAGETLAATEAAAASLPAGAAGVETLLRDPTLLAGRIVHLSGVPMRGEDGPPGAPAALADADFGVAVPGAASLERVVEYCQWKETRHERSRSAGTDAEGKALREVEVSFAYEKAWRRRLVSSDLFDAPVAYHNPGRDPFPAYKREAGAVLGMPGGPELVVAPGLAKPLPAEPFHLPPGLGPPQAAAFHNFVASDGVWIYSKQQQDAASRAMQAAASYMLEGVVDTGIEGTCTAGDIRVRFDVAFFPATVTVVAGFDGRTLEPFALGATGGDVFVSQPGELSVHDAVARHVQGVGQQLVLVRVFCGGALAVLALVAFLVSRRRQKIMKEEEGKTD